MTPCSCLFHREKLKGWGGKIHMGDENIEQAGAELGQAQHSLG